MEQNHDITFNNLLLRIPNHGLKDLYMLKGTVVQIEKALINDYYVFQKYPENFTFQLFIVLK